MFLLSDQRRRCRLSLSLLQTIDWRRAANFHLFEKLSPPSRLAWRLVIIIVTTKFATSLQLRTNMRQQIVVVLIKFDTICQSAKHKEHKLVQVIKWRAALWMPQRPPSMMNVPLNKQIRDTSNESGGSAWLVSRPTLDYDVCRAICFRRGALATATAGAASAAIGALFGLARNRYQYQHQRLQ